MKKLILSSFTFTFVFLIVSFNVSFGQIEEFTAKGGNTEIIQKKSSLDEQAEQFSIRIGNLLKLSEKQIKEITKFRLVYLKELEKAKYNKKLSKENFSLTVKKLQEEYDHKFSNVLTSSQKNKIMRREFTH